MEANDWCSSLLVKHYLTDIGCCARCSLIFLGASVADVCKTIDDDPDTASNQDQYKKCKESICISCLGILQQCVTSYNLKKITEAVLQGDYDAATFSLAISLPVCLGLRTYAIWLSLLKNYSPLHLENILELRRNHLSLLKDIWKNIVGPRIEPTISKQFVAGPNVDFCVTVHAEYPCDENECSLLEKLNPKKFGDRRKCHKKFREGIFTRQVVEKTLNECSDSEFLTHCPGLPLEPKVPVSFCKIFCSSASLYLAGRYRKFSRDLPQTPWLVEGERRLETSVQECICGPLLLQEVKAESVKFSASGREDVDVRCLGTGRPFVLEFINPRRTLFTLKNITNIQNNINLSTNRINIQDLQIVNKRDIGFLKEGELEKTKSYCALCISRGFLRPEDLKSLDSISDLTVHQLTPIRVLHRRPLCSRPRIIHTMRSEYLNDKFFKLYVTTQAGTYVKEFVHGDFGRTRPNLGSILGVEVDIVALDVENVKLDWPPKLQTGSIKKSD